MDTESQPESKPEQSNLPAIVEPAERPPLELVEVPVYSLTLPQSMKEALAQSPWQRVEGGTCCFEHELAGILIGYAIVSSDKGFKEGTGAVMAQAGAEIMNLILLCGGKLPKAQNPKSEGGVA